MPVGPNLIRSKETTLPTQKQSSATTTRHTDATGSPSHRYNQQQYQQKNTYKTQRNTIAASKS